MPVSSTRRVTSPPDEDAAALDVVLDGVFRKVEDDLIDIVVRCEDGAVAGEGGPELDMPLRGERPQELHDAPDGVADVDALPRTDDGAVEAGEGEQLFRRAGEPLRLRADIAGKFAHRRRVDAVALHDAVGEQADGRQRRFELVRGV